MLVLDDYFYQIVLLILSHDYHTSYVTFLQQEIQSDLEGESGSAPTSDDGVPKSDGGEAEVAEVTEVAEVAEVDYVIF